jgi:hypothetical protein
MAESTKTGAVLRYQIGDYISKTSTENYQFMGTGFKQLDESPQAQTEETVYICDKASTTDIISYKPQFAFSTHLMKNQEAVMMLYDVGRNELTGSDAELYYVRVDLYDPTDDENTFKARKFLVSVEVSSCSGEGGQKIEVSGNLNAKGDFVDGTFNTTTKTFKATE